MGFNSGFKGLTDNRGQCRNYIKLPHIITSPADQLAPLKNTKSIASFLARIFDCLTEELPETKTTQVHKMHLIHKDNR